MNLYNPDVCDSLFTKFDKDVFLTFILYFLEVVHVSKHNDCSSCCGKFQIFKIQFLLLISFFSAYIYSSNHYVLIYLLI